MLGNHKIKCLNCLLFKVQNGVKMWLNSMGKENMQFLTYIFYAWFFNHACPVDTYTSYLAICLNDTCVKYTTKIKDLPTDQLLWYNYIYKPGSFQLRPQV